MPSLKGSRTEGNLKEAFAKDAQANRRYRYFTEKANSEGFRDISNVFRSTANRKSSHAYGHLEFLEEVGDPETGAPIGSTPENLKAAVAAEVNAAPDLYLGMAKAAREEGFDEIADWFETLIKADKTNVARFRKALDTHE